ncbi:MAG: hypothetical protein QW051_03030 [Candidatus Aenigmatarchaeota archaeon]
MKVYKGILISIAIAVLISYTVIESVRAEGLLSNFFEMIKRWFEASPLGNIFTTPVKRTEAIELIFYPQVFEFDAKDALNFTSENLEIENFKGNVNINMENKIITLKESGSSLLIKEKFGTVNIDGIKINLLELKNMRLTLISGNWNETTENGTLMLNDFLGSGTIKEGLIELKGNVSRIVKG